MIQELIVTCGCGDTDSFAKNAYKLLFKHSSAPAVYHTPINTPHPSLNQMAQALTKSDEKFAYLFRWDDTDYEAWNLLSGKRVH